MARIKVLTGNIDSIFHYYEYVIKDTDTPEILAEKVYGTPEAHWLIMLTNGITDPQYDWPMPYNVFGKYIVDKYTTLAAAKTTVHHWEKILKTVDSDTGDETTIKSELTESAYDASSLATSEPAGTAYTIGSAVSTIYEWKTIIYNYDWEVEQNDLRRNIKLIKPDYYSYIQQNLAKLMRLKNNYRTVT
jgi:hypothetical protein